MKTYFKRLVMCLWLHDLLSAKAVKRIFKVFNIKGA